MSPLELIIVVAVVLGLVAAVRHCPRPAGFFAGALVVLLLLLVGLLLMVGTAAVVWHYRTAANVAVAQAEVRAAAAREEKHKALALQQAANRPEAERDDTSAAPPAAKPVRDPARPEWVDQPAQYDAQRKVYRRVVTVGPYTTGDECRQELPAVLDQAVRDYARQLPGMVGRPEVVFPGDYLEDRIVQQQWEEPIQASFGPMVQLHVLLEFDEEARRELRQLAELEARRTRLGYAAASAAVLLGLLAVTHGGLRMAGGRRTGRGGSLQPAA